MAQMGETLLSQAQRSASGMPTTGSQTQEQHLQKLRILVALRGDGCSMEELLGD
jgi:hypothetical protein